MITRKTCILQWEHVVQNLEVIVENKRQQLNAFDYRFGREWLQGFERGLEHARNNLEHARNEPFFLVFTNTIPVAETGGQLLNTFMDVIIDEIDERIEEQRKIDAIEAVAEIAALRAKVALSKPEHVVFSESKEVELFIQEPEPEPIREYSMMDGIRQWIAGNKIVHQSLKVLDISKLWRTV